MGVVIPAWMLSASGSLYSLPYNAAAADKAPVINSAGTAWEWRDLADAGLLSRGTLADARLSSAIQRVTDSIAGSRLTGSVDDSLLSVNIPRMVGGKLNAANLPAIAISETSVVSSQAAMLSLVAQTGDIAVRTDLNKTFILAVNDPTVLANWQELLTPTSPVQSVNGMTGPVVLTTTNISEGTNLYFTQARSRAAFSASSPLSYNSTTGALSISLAAVATSGSTSDLTEGTKLFYTDARARASISGGTGISYDSSTGIITNTYSYTPPNNIVYTDNTQTISGAKTFTGVPLFTIANVGSSQQTVATFQATGSHGNDYFDFRAGANNARGGGIFFGEKSGGSDSGFGESGIKFDLNATTLLQAGNWPINLQTNGTNRLIVTGAGNVLIGTFTDNGTDKLQVGGSINNVGPHAFYGTSSTQLRQQFLITPSWSVSTDASRLSQVALSVFNYTTTPNADGHVDFLTATATSSGSTVTSAAAWTFGSTVTINDTSGVAGITSTSDAHSLLFAKTGASNSPFYVGARTGNNQNGIYLSLSQNPTYPTFFLDAGFGRFYLNPQSLSTLDSLGVDATLVVGGRAGPVPVALLQASSQSNYLIRGRNSSAADVFTVDSAGAVTATGVFVNPAGSSTTSPASFGFSPGFTSGQAARLQFGDAYNILQNGAGDAMQLSSYHEFVIQGGRSTQSSPNFIGGSGLAYNTRVINTFATTVGLTVEGATSQTGDLQRWMVGSTVASMSAAGVLTATGGTFSGTVSTNLISTTATSLTLRQTGDSFGTSYLKIANGSGNTVGAALYNSGIDLVDFLFVPSSGVTGSLRFEHRGGQNQVFSQNTSGEFQFVVSNGVKFALGASAFGTYVPAYFFSTAEFDGYSSTGTARKQFYITPSFAVSTDASRTSSVTFGVSDYNADRPFLTATATGSAVNVTSAAAWTFSGSAITAPGFTISGGVTLNNPYGYLPLDSNGNAVGNWVPRQGTAASQSTLTLAAGSGIELAIDTDTKAIRLLDTVTPGGTVISGSAGVSASSIDLAATATPGTVVLTASSNSHPIYDITDSRTSPTSASITLPAPQFPGQRLTLNLRCKSTATYTGGFSVAFSGITGTALNVPLRFLGADSNSYTGIVVNNLNVSSVAYWEMVAYYTSATASLRWMLIATSLSAATLETYATPV